MPKVNDQDKVDQAVLALLSLGRHEGYRAWKAFDWEVMGALVREGLYQRSRGQGEVSSVLHYSLRRRQSGRDNRAHGPQNGPF